MRGYINVPANICCKACKYCGSRPIIALAGIEGYVVKCPNNAAHYHTKPGIIDIEDWNIHNTMLYDNDYDLQLKNCN